jgi:hypothetical protein
VGMAAGMLCRLRYAPSILVWRSLHTATMPVHMTITVMVPAAGMPSHPQSTRCLATSPHLCRGTSSTIALKPRTRSATTSGPPAGGKRRAAFVSPLLPDYKQRMEKQAAGDAAGAQGS